MTEPVRPDIAVEDDRIVWSLRRIDAEELAYLLMRTRSWEQDGRLLLEATRPLTDGAE